MNASVDPDTEIGARARAWVLAVAGEDFPPARSAELRAWLEADPRHAAAYDFAEQTLILMDEALIPTAVAQPARSRRVWLAPGLAIAAGLVAAAVLATPPASISTAAGETRDVTLPDGSHIVLGPSSSLRPTWRLAQRAYVLQTGEAFFAVAKDAARPFTVTAGETKVRVLGTRFDVNRGLGERVRVEVEQGLVEVSRNTASGTSVARVAAGQGALSDTQGVSTTARKNAVQAGAWRRGRLEYADARLEDVIADLNRYGLRARVAPGAAGLKVTAGLRADQASAFVAGLPRVLPVVVSREASGGMLIQPAR